MATFVLISSSIIILLLLILDYLIFKRNIPRLRWVEIAYITQALLLDLGLPLLLFTLSGTTNNPTRVLITWLILILLINFVVKITFAFFSIIQWVWMRISKKNSRSIIVIGGAFTAIAFFVMLYGATIGRSWIRVEHVVITSDQLPKSFDGFRIAQFSDLHLGNMGMGNPLVKNLVEKINQLNPDIVVGSGDLLNLHSGELNAERMALLSSFIAPVYSVLGNHDLSYYAYNITEEAEKSVSELIDKQKIMGWELLNNRHTWERRGMDSIAIVGVGYPNDGRFGGMENRYSGSNIKAAFNGVQDSQFSLLIAHTPSMFDSIPKYAKPNLTVSGHVHAMQLKLNIGGWSWSPAKFLFTMWSGLWNKSEHYLYVNDGAGYTLTPLRIGTRPEITLFELKSTEK